MQKQYCFRMLMLSLQQLRAPFSLPKIFCNTTKISVFYLAIVEILVTDVIIKNTKAAKRGMIAFETSILFPRDRALIALSAPR